ncbi:hypothetical protein [Nocardia sp. NPDC051463]|uniref:hypothetical protein n=1 Tax=Nocardia sp. NPDC051463 TaxID=3154845 RepID=UPI00344051DB
MYKAVASSLTKREAALIEHYLDEQRTLDEQLGVTSDEILDSDEKVDAYFLD